MKKVILLFGATVFALTSCSKDNSGSANGPVAGLIKTIVSGATTTTYSYDGSKIITATQPSFSEGYTYAGDLISATTLTASGYKNTTQYTYNNGQLFSSLTQDNGGSGTTMNNTSGNSYTYNSDGTISVAESTYTNGVSALTDTRKFTLANGNIVREETFDTSNASTGVTIYEYDTKNNPYKKVLGYDKLINATVTSLNNVTKLTKTSGSGSSLNTVVATYTYTYNSDGFPLTKTITVTTTVGTGAPSTTTSTSQYSY